MVRMAQEWQGSNARRRSLESAMKETQARTKVVLRHLPPTLSNAAFQEQIAAKFAGSYTLCSFHPGKTRCAISSFPFLFPSPCAIIDKTRPPARPLSPSHPLSLSLIFLFLNDKKLLCPVSVCPRRRFVKPSSNARAANRFIDRRFKDFLFLIYLISGAVLLRR